MEYFTLKYSPPFLSRSLPFLHLQICGFKRLFGSQTLKSLRITSVELHIRPKLIYKQECYISKTGTMLPAMLCHFNPEGGHPTWKILFFKKKNINMQLFFLTYKCCLKGSSNYLYMLGPRKFCQMGRGGSTLIALFFVFS